MAMQPGTLQNEECETVAAEGACVLVIQRPLAYLLLCCCCSRRVDRLRLRLRPGPVAVCWSALDYVVWLW